MNRLRVFLIVILTTICFNASADVFAGYASFCNLPVVVGGDPQAASARNDQFGHPYIHVDPGVMANLTASRMFVLAHECGHHILGHTSALGQQARYLGGTAVQELEADCWAAKQLKALGYERDLNRVVIEGISRGHFTSAGYPSGVQRAGNVLACAEVDVRTEATVDTESKIATEENGDAFELTASAYYKDGRPAYTFKNPTNSHVRCEVLWMKSTISGGDLEVGGQVGFDLQPRENFVLRGFWPVPVKQHEFVEGDAKVSCK